MDGVLIFAFVSGAIATVNPCGFALLPAYLARRIKTKNSDDHVAAVLRAIGVGALTSSGFVIVFGIVGAAISLGAYWVIGYMPWAGLVIGLTLILSGVFILSGRKIFLRIPVWGGQVLSRTWTGDLLFGIGYGTASLSCTLPIFLAVTGTAITGNLTGSILTFVSYALGMGTVLMVLAIGASLARQGLLPWVRQAGVFVNRLSGGIMVFAGTYVTFYWGIILFYSDNPDVTRLITYGDIIASPMRKWLGEQSGAITLLGAALLIALFLSWALWSRFTRKPKIKKSYKTTLSV